MLYYLLLVRARNSVSFLRYKPSKLVHYTQRSAVATGWKG